jgi:hypothetical protein
MNRPPVNGLEFSFGPLDKAELTQIDSILRAANLIRSTELGYARDRHGNLVERLDPQGHKLDAFSVGIIDAIRIAVSASAAWLPLLTYMLKLGEHGADGALHGAEQMLKLSRAETFDAYVEQGRQTVYAVFADHRDALQAYAALLRAEERAGV